MRYIKVKDKDNLLRDSESNGLINTDDSEYTKYVNQYIKEINSRKKIEVIETEIKELKNDISEIKNLLLNLTQK